MLRAGAGGCDGDRVVVCTPAVVGGALSAGGIGPPEPAGWQPASRTSMVANAARRRFTTTSTGGRVARFVRPEMLTRVRADQLRWWQRRVAETGVMATTDGHHPAAVRRVLVVRPGDVTERGRPGTGPCRAPGTEFEGPAGSLSAFGSPRRCSVGVTPAAPHRGGRPCAADHAPAPNTPAPRARDLAVPGAASRCYWTSPASPSPGVTTECVSPPSELGSPAEPPVA